MDFGRILTAMVTPFTDDFKVDYNEARKLARYLVDNGSDGIVVAGTTGESPTLSAEEKLKLFEVVFQEVGSEAKVIAGTGSNNTADTIALTKGAEKIGVDGAMLVVPYYNKPPQESLYQHFKAVAEATSLEVILYNVPGRTAANLMPETVSRLADIDNVVAIKEASGNLDQVTEIIRLVGQKLTIYSGDDALTLPMLALGCHGVISVSAHVVGLKMQEMVKNYLAGNVAEAAKIHAQIFPVYKAMFFTTSPIPVKAAMNLMGHKVGGLRLPLTPLEEKDLQKLKAILEKEGIL